MFWIWCLCAWVWKWSRLNTSVKYLNLRRMKSVVQDKVWYNAWQKVAAEGVAFLLHIRKVTGSTLAPKTGSPDSYYSQLYYLFCISDSIWTFFFSYFTLFVTLSPMQHCTVFKKLITIFLKFVFAKNFITYLTLHNRENQVGCSANYLKSSAPMPRLVSFSCLHSWLFPHPSINVNLALMFSL